MVVMKRDIAVLLKVTNDKLNYLSLEEKKLEQECVILEKKRTKKINQLEKNKEISSKFFYYINHDQERKKLKVKHRTKKIKKMNIIKKIGGLSSVIAMLILSPLMILQQSSAVIINSAWILLIEIFGTVIIKEIMKDLILDIDSYIQYKNTFSKKSFENHYNNSNNKIKKLERQYNNIHVRLIVRKKELEQKKSYSSILERHKQILMVGLYKQQSNLENAQKQKENLSKKYELISNNSSYQEKQKVFQMYHGWNVINK